MRQTIPQRLMQQGARQGDRPALWYRVQTASGEVWKSIGWRTYAERCQLFAGGMLAEGCAKGDVVAIVGNNSPEWVIADVGAMCAGGVAAGIYQTLKPHQIQYVAHHCEAKILVLENKGQWEKYLEVRDELPHVKRVVMVSDGEDLKDPIVMTFSEFLDSGRPYLDELADRFKSLEGEDLATLIYTSGTTGEPKGVMLNHDNLHFTANQAIEMLGSVAEDDCVVSYLPLSHIAEQMFTIHLAIAAGYPVWFCEDIARLKETLIAARPTFMIAVPRVWEKFKIALEAKLAEATGAKKAIVEWSMGVGLKVGMQIFEKGEPSMVGGMKYGVAKTLFFDKIKEQLGLDRMKIAVTAAAPIGRDVLDFFMAIGLPIHEVYGQSEDCGPTTFNRPFAGQRRLGTVGLPFPNTEVKIAEDGEILVKGRHVFQGYYKNPEATAETLVDGWMHSGDIGEFDRHGFLRITDRKKDLIITAGGKNVAPQSIEKLLRAIKGVGHAVVVGDRRKFLSALLTIDPEQGPALARANGWPEDPAALVKHEAFQAYITAEVEKANSELAKYETIKRWTILPEDFTPDTGELTPTQKVKRKVVNDKYSAEIEAFYEGLS